MVTHPGNAAPDLACPINTLYISFPMRYASRESETEQADNEQETALYG